ncbi:hypothetical protein EI94DRAFT_1750774, partial [Lactarius quietus]
SHSHPCLDHFPVKMVDFQSPEVIAKCFLVVVKLWHVLDGIFIWEFFIALDYEWSVIRGHRPYRWTIWIYSLTRMCTLIAVVLNMVGLDSSSPINCQVSVVFELIFVYSALAAASSLIVLRIIAIWDGNRIVVAIAICAWCNNIAFFINIHCPQIRATWSPTNRVCEVLNTETTTKSIISILVADVVLLLAMLVGLLRLRVYGTMFALGKFLWQQGLIWLFLATVAEVPPAVFISLNLNYNNGLYPVGNTRSFQSHVSNPALIIMSIGATRIHRSLTDFTPSNSQAFNIYSNQRGHTGNIDPKRIFAVPISLNQVEVTVQTTSDSENYSPANMYQRGPSRANSPLQDGSLVLNIGNDLENGIQ